MEPFKDYAHIIHDDATIEQMIMIPVEEYKELIKENAELKADIKTIRSVHNIMQKMREDN